MDRREHLRFRLRVPVTYSWRLDGAEVYGTGFSRDISTHGIFIVCDDLPPEKSTVQLEVSLPSENVQGSRICLRAAGQVVRTVDVGSTVGFAAGAKFILSKALTETVSVSRYVEKKAAN